MVEGPILCDLPLQCIVIFCVQNTEMNKITVFCNVSKQILKPILSKFVSVTADLYTRYLKESPGGAVFTCAKMASYGETNIHYFRTEIAEFRLQR